MNRSRLPTRAHFVANAASTVSATPQSRRVTPSIRRRSDPPASTNSRPESIAESVLIAAPASCGDMVRGSGRTLMRDCLHCRPHGLNMRADHVCGVASRLDISSVLRRDLLAVVPHHGREFDHFLAQLAAYVLSTFPDRGKQCPTLSDHLLRRFVGLVNETERRLNGFVAAG